MSIEQIQIRRALETIVRESLKKGRNPRIRESINSADFSHIGKPNPYGMLAQYERNLSSANFNKIVEYYEDDLEVLDLALGELANWTIDSRDRFSGRFESAQNLYEKLALKVSVLASAIKSGTNSVFAITEGFNSLEYIDLVNTDAYVDTYNGQVTLPKGTDDYTIYSLDNGISIDSIQVSKNNDDWEALPVSSNFEPMISFTSYKDVLYAKYVVHLDAQKPQLDDEVNVVAIDITIPRYWSKIGEVIVKISDDKKNWRTLNTSTSTEKQTYIPDGPFEWLEVHIKKHEYDEKKVNSSGIIEYIYLPFVKHIYVRAYGYRNRAVIQTNNYEISPVAQNLGMSSMQFFVEEFSPGDTSTQHFIRLEEGPWIEVHNEDILSLAPTAFKEVSKEPTIYKAKSNFLYQVTTEVPYSENCDLFEGFDQAELQVAELNYANLTLSSWVNRTDLYTQYLDLKDTPFLAGNRSYKLFFKVKTDRTKEFKVNDFSIKEEGTLSAIDIDTRITINKQTIAPRENNDYTYSFYGTLLNGENYINIIINIPSGTTGGRLHLNGNLFQGNYAFCKRRSITSLDSLSFSIPYSENGYFALDSENCVVLNYLPPPYARYLYRYQEVNGTIPANFSYKAILIGTSNATPVIDSIAVLIAPPIRR